MALPVLPRIFRWFVAQYTVIRTLLRELATMKKSILFSTRLLSLILAGSLLHTQLAFGAGCDLPMFAGARLFPSVTGSQMLATGDFNHDGFIDLAVANGPGGIISILLGNA